MVVIGGSEQAAKESFTAFQAFEDVGLPSNASSEQLNPQKWPRSTRRI
jgi:hypothetical protein